MSPMGSLEVITGPMFGGKTDELIRRLRRARIARQKVQVLLPAIDTRCARYGGFEYGNPTSRTQCLIDGKPAPIHGPAVIAGASELCEARCRAHHRVPKT